MSSVSCTTNKLLVTNTMATTAATKLLKFQNIAPAPPHASEESKLRKYTQRSVPYNNDQTQSVLRRNARERNRVKQVNNSFARLRQHIPQTIIADLTKGGGRGPHKKISKVDTLRIAVEYIRRLQDLLDDLNGAVITSNNNSVNISNNLSYTSPVVNSCKTSSNNSTSNSNSTSSSSSNNNVNSTADNNFINSNTSATSSLSTGINNTSLYYTHSTSGANSNNNSNLQSLLEASNAVQQLNFNQSTTLLSPVSLSSYSPQHNTQLDNDCNSPTSSFNSSLSFDSGTYHDHHNIDSTQQSSQQQQQQQRQQQHQQQHEQQQQQQQQQQLSPQTAVHHQLNAHLQLKFEPYDNFQLNDDDCTPDDEEILDYISLWQDQ